MSNMTLNISKLLTHFDSKAKKGKVKTVKAWVLETHDAHIREEYIYNRGGNDRREPRQRASFTLHPVNIVNTVRMMSPSEIRPTYAVVYTEESITEIDTVNDIAVLTGCKVASDAAQVRIGGDKRYPDLKLSNLYDDLRAAEAAGRKHIADSQKAIMDKMDESIRDKGKELVEARKDKADWLKFLKS